MTFGAIALGIAWFAAWLVPRLAFPPKKKKEKQDVPTGQGKRAHNLRSATISQRQDRLCKSTATAVILPQQNAPHRFLCPVDRTVIRAAQSANAALDRLLQLRNTLKRIEYLQPTRCCFI